MAKRKASIYAMVAVSVLVGVVLIGLVLKPDYMSLQYLQRVIFNGDSEVTDWQNVFPERTIANDPNTVSTLPVALLTNVEIESLSSVVYHSGGKKLTIGSDFQKFLADTDTDSFVIIRDGQLVYDAYAQGTTGETPRTSMSVAKSFMSALAGIAVSEGRFAIDDPVVQYLPELQGKISDDMTIHHLLTMTAGNAYDGEGGLTGDDTKTYWSPDLRSLNLEYFRSAKTPGAHMGYNDYQPQILGMILERTTGTTISEYLEQKIWKPAGMQYPASWSLDSQKTGFEQSAVGLNARSLDFARFGLLYLNGGKANGRQIVPESWVAASTQANQNYGFYWWSMPAGGDRPDYYARGKHGQFIYVSPASNTVIVRTGSSVGKVSDWPQVLQQITAKLVL